MTKNLCKKVLSEGGSLIPLMIPNQDSKGLGLMNPSILIDQTKILLNLRNINYTLYHCEGQQLFNNRFGPLAYLHPENDLHLRTYNFYCELDPVNLNITKHFQIDTSTFDKPPVWDFVGLEDARLVRWEGKLFACGVRRDTKPNGEGRMELSELIEKPSSELQPNESPIKEISRSRIQPPGDPTYCEKNWMPILDMPYHFVKWCNPTQVVKVNTVTKTSETIFLSKSHIPNLPDFRGGSQVIKYKNYRMCLIHEVNLFKNKLQQKDATYTHRFIIWDNDWNIIKLSDSFSFMDGEIEFCCGMALYKKNLLVTFGFQDNAAYLLKIPEKMIDEILGLKEPKFDWSKVNPSLLSKINEEIFTTNVYQKHFSVEQNDIVVDIGANIGAFTYSILNKKPKHVFCIEPDRELFSTLLKNTKSNNCVICINKNIDLNFIKDYNISKIDFLKIDCENKEYNIFNEENFEWIVKNVKKIAAKFYINDIEKFKNFRDTFLKHFNNFKTNSTQNNIQDLWNDDIYIKGRQIIIYILNDPNIVTTKKPEIKLVIDNKITTPILKEEGLSYNDVTKRKKWQTTKWPTFEITTNILYKGCILNCVFCPQKTLINKYNGEKELSLENFKKAIDKIPKEITIIFSGFSEPWINKNCTDMVLYAHEKGHSISIFTSGIGMDIEDFERIKHIPFSSGPIDPQVGYLGYPINNGGFTLHLPDNEEYAHHPITEKYIKLLEYIKEHLNEVSNFHLTCMGTVHNKVKHIFPESPIIDAWSRANNIANEIKFRPEIINKIDGHYKSAYRGENPVTCMCDEKLYHNVMLPNGDVVLCCMDYNLEHILGNLFEQEYNDIIPEPETKFNLCRFCENGAQPQ